MLKAATIYPKKTHHRVLIDSSKDSKSHRVKHIGKVHILNHHINSL